MWWEELAVIADEAGRRRQEGDAGLAAAGGPHVDQLGLAQAHLLHHHAGVLFVDVDLALLDRLQALARRGVVAIEHARARDGGPEAFAAQRLAQQDRKSVVAGKSV